MPLPFAPPPKESSLYQQLESTTLQTLTADQLDTIRAKTFSQGTEGNEDEYRRLLLLGLASNALSLSGPIPDQMELIEVDNTDANYLTVFTVPQGQVWTYVCGSRNVASGVSGSVTTEVDIFNPNTNARVLFIDMSSTSSSDFPLIETNPGGEIYISHPCVLRVKAEGTFTSVTTTHALQRVR